MNGSGGRGGNVAIITLSLSVCAFIPESEHILLNVSIYTVYYMYMYIHPFQVSMRGSTLHAERPI